MASIHRKCLPVFYRRPALKGWPALAFFTFKVSSSTAVSSLPTLLVSVTSLSDTVFLCAVVFGTAPVHLASDRAPINKPVLCYSYAEDKNLILQ